MEFLNRRQMLPPAGIRRQKKYVIQFNIISFFLTSWVHLPLPSLRALLFPFHSPSSSCYSHWPLPNVSSQGLHSDLFRPCRSWFSDSLRWWWHSFVMRSALRKTTQEMRFKPSVTPLMSHFAIQACIIIHALSNIGTLSPRCVFALVLVHYLSVPIKLECTRP